LGNERTLARRSQWKSSEKHQAVVGTDDGTIPWNSNCIKNSYPQEIQGQIDNMLRANHASDKGINH
jgi:hypothetical protein